MLTALTGAFHVFGSQLPVWQVPKSASVNLIGLDASTFDASHAVHAQRASVDWRAAQVISGIACCCNWLALHVFTAFVRAGRLSQWRFLLLLCSTQVLSYHVIPAGAVLSSQLTDGQQLTTALAGAAPLVVKLKDSKVGFQGATNDAYVVVPDIKAGLSVVHVIDDVLLPAGIGKAPASSG